MQKTTPRGRREVGIDLPVLGSVAGDPGQVPDLLNLMVVLHRNPVTSALFLVVAFCSLAGIYIVMRARSERWTK